MNYKTKLDAVFYELLDVIAKSDTYFQIAHTATKAAMAVDDMLLYSFVCDKIIPYESYILEKNDQFIVEFNADENAIIAPIFQKLQALWPTCTYKDIIWHYLKTMVLLYHRVPI
jgi:hypothetical protein